MARHWQIFQIQIMNDESTSHHLKTIKSIRIIYNKLNQEERRYFKELLFGDPLAKIYFRVTLAYLLIMSVALLWPFDFALIEGNNAQWIRDPAGISFPDDGQLISDGPARSLFEHMQQGSGLSIEVWIETDHIGQTGPARIISYSLNTLSRNFTVGQSFDQLIFRLRTSETDLNGTQPHLVVDNVFVGTGLLHIVVTYNFSEQLVFINGELRKKARFLKGDFSNWDPSHKLVIGNEASGGRPWLGKIFYAAIYNRPLYGREVRENYQAGLTGQKHKAAVHNHAFDGISARYLFDEAKGDRVFNRVNSRSRVPLVLPAFIRKKDKSFLSIPERFLSSSRYIDDFIMNVMIFIPLGFLVHATFRNRYGNTVWISVIAAAAGIFFTFTVETLQYFSLTRDSSSFDIFANSLGMVAGVMCDRFYAYYLQWRAKIFSEHFMT
jgi:VanZ family protein